MSKKIIICGIKDNVNDIISRLSDTCVVIGYCDISDKLQKFNFFDGKPYASVSEYSSQEYDYIVIAYKSSQSIEAALCECSKHARQLVVYEWFKDATIGDIVGKFNNSALQPNQLIFGMSHSEVDIQTHHFNDKAFKFSLPSMDMFCHYSILNRIIKECPEKLSEVKSIVLEMPYYIFNYDLSRSVRSAKKRLMYFKSFGDYHNYGKSPEEIEIVKQFDVFLRVFACGNPKEYKNNTEGYEIKNGIKNKLISLIDQLNVRKENNRVWCKIHEATINENILLFENMVALIKDKIPEASVTVLVCPFNPLFVSKNKMHVVKTKDVFYEIVDKYGLDVEDDFNLYKNPFHFRDHCHLKDKQARKYTDYLKRKIAI